MKFRNNEKDEFIKLVDIYLNNSYVMQMKKYTQRCSTHIGGITATFR